jgi:hypothetical protein
MCEAYCRGMPSPEEQLQRMLSFSISAQISASEIVGYIVVTIPPRKIAPSIPIYVFAIPGQGALIAGLNFVCILRISMMECRCVLAVRTRHATAFDAPESSHTSTRLNRRDIIISSLSAMALLSSSPCKSGNLLLQQPLPAMFVGLYLRHFQRAHQVLKN